MRRVSKTNKITFRAKDNHVMEVRERPQPASNFVPEWWDTMPHYTTPTNTLELSPMPSVTVKRCLSAFDGLTAGYMVTLWADVQVKYDEIEKTSIKWTTQEMVFDTWKDYQTSTYEIPDNFTLPVFKYFHGWVIKTPPGWSALFTHPIGYQNLPFRVIPWIVDTDKLETDINVPIVFKKGFEGILEKGTPIFQIIPIYRSKWESNYELGTPEQHRLNNEKLRTKIVSSYARYIREPKSYK